MKKKSLSVLLCVAMLMFGSVALTGCGGKDNTSGDSQSTEESSDRELDLPSIEPSDEAEGSSDEAQGSSDEAQEPESTEASYTTLEEYIATSDGEEIYGYFKSGLGDDGIQMEVVGNVMTCTYSMSDIALADYSEEQRAEIMASMQETMPSTMESLSDYFVPAVELFEEESGIDGITLKVVYSDANGELLYEHEFTSK